MVIRAKYTHGKPLRGKATVSVTGSMGMGLLVKKIIDVDGSGEVTFDIVNELKYEASQYYGTKSFEVHAELVENLSGLSQSAKKCVKVHNKTYDIITDLNYGRLYTCESTIKATVSRT